MQQGIGHAPLLSIAHQRDRLVVQANHLAVTLLLFAIDESNGIPDSDFVAPKSLSWLLTDLNVSVVQVDGGLGDQPASAGFPIEDDGLFAPELENLAVMGAVR